MLAAMRLMFSFRQLKIYRRGARWRCNFAAMETDNRHKNRQQLRIAGAVTLAGVALIIAGFIVSPLGEIHSSVLVAFGECLTFGGALLGIDYRHKEGGGNA